MEPIQHELAVLRVHVIFFQEAVMSRLYLVRYGPWERTWVTYADNVTERNKI